MLYESLLLIIFADDDPAPMSDEGDKPASEGKDPSPKSPPEIKPCLKGKTRTPVRSASIWWDEEVIADHDKERGTRTKIEEPNTPFRHMDSTSDVEDGSSTDSKPTKDHVKHGVEPGELLARLAHLEERASQNEDASDESTPTQVQRGLSFEEKRRSHYEGEYKAALRAAKAEDDD